MQETAAHSETHWHRLRSSPARSSTSYLGLFGLVDVRRGPVLCFLTGLPLRRVDVKGSRSAERKASSSSMMFGQLPKRGKYKNPYCPPTNRKLTLDHTKPFSLKKQHGGQTVLEKQLTILPGHCSAIPCGTPNKFNKLLLKTDPEVSSNNSLLPPMKPHAPNKHQSMNKAYHSQRLPKYI